MFSIFDDGDKVPSSVDPVKLEVFDCIPDCVHVVGGKTDHVGVRIHDTDTSTHDRHNGVGGQDDGG